MEVVLCIFPIGFFLVFISASIYISYENEQRKRIGWRRFAQANRLKFVPGRLILGPSCYVIGKYRDCLLELDTTSRSSGKSSIAYTRLQLHHRNYKKLELPLAQFPIGQPLTLEAVEGLLLSNLSSRVKGEIAIKNKGGDWSYEQRGVVTDEKSLQVSSDLLVQLMKNYSMVLALGGETVTALYDVIRTKYHVLQPVAHQLLQDIAEGTTSRLRRHTHIWFCPCCLTGCAEHKINLGWWQSITYYGCRTCGQSREFLKVPLVTVLDRQMEAERAENQTELRVNWLRRRNLFDFSRVEIVEATDEEVERFAVQVGNDTDEWRKPRYKRMNCVISPQCRLSENTLRILERMFGEVRVEV